MSQSVERELQEAGAEAATGFDAVIVGSGFSGLYMLHRVRNELGLSARLLEASNGVGSIAQRDQRADHAPV